MEDSEIQNGGFFGVDELGELQEGLDADILVNDNAHDKTTKKNLLGKRGEMDSKVKKSKKEIFKEIIKKSKMEKYKRMEEREEQKRMVEEMKDEFKGIANKLNFLDKVEMKLQVNGNESEGSDDEDYNNFLKKVQHKGLMRPERQIKKKEEKQIEEEEEEEIQQEDESEQEESEGDDELIGDYQKVKKVQYNARVDQMEDFQVKEENKQTKKFQQLVNPKQEKLLNLLENLEDEFSESEDSDDNS